MILMYSSVQVTPQMKLLTRQLMLYLQHRMSAHGFNSTLLMHLLARYCTLKFLSTTFGILRIAVGTAANMRNKSWGVCIRSIRLHVNRGHCAFCCFIAEAASAVQIFELSVVMNVQHSGKPQWLQVSWMMIKSIIGACRLSTFHRPDCGLFF
jgi:hypothetical protein